MLLIFYFIFFVFVSIYLARFQYQSFKRRIRDIKVPKIEATPYVLLSRQELNRFIVEKQSIFCTEHLLNIGVVRGFISKYLGVFLTRMRQLSLVRLQELATADGYLYLSNVEYTIKWLNRHTVYIFASATASKIFNDAQHIWPCTNVHSDDSVVRSFKLPHLIFSITTVTVCCLLLIFSKGDALVQKARQQVNIELEQVIWQAIAPSYLVKQINTANNHEALEQLNSIYQKVVREPNAKLWVIKYHEPKIMLLPGKNLLISTELLQHINSEQALWYIIAREQYYQVNYWRNFYWTILDIVNISQYLAGYDVGKILLRLYSFGHSSLDTVLQKDIEKQVIQEVMKRYQCVCGLKELVEVIAPNKTDALWLQTYLATFKQNSAGAMPEVIWRNLDLHTVIPEATNDKDTPNFIKNYTAEAHTVFAEYESEIGAVIIESWQLPAGNLANQSIVSFMQNLHKANKEVSKYRAKLLAINVTHTPLEPLSDSQQLKLQEKQNNMLLYLDELIHLDMQLVNSLNSMLRFLQKRLGTFYIDDKHQVHFVAELTNKQFTAIAEQINILLKQRAIIIGAIYE